MREQRVRRPEREFWPGSSGTNLSLEGTPTRQLLYAATLTPLTPAHLDTGQGMDNKAQGGATQPIATSQVGPTQTIGPTDTTEPLARRQP